MVVREDGMPVGSDPARFPSVIEREARVGMSEKISVQSMSPFSSNPSIPVDNGDGVDEGGDWVAVGSEEEEDGEIVEGEETPFENKLFWR